MCQERRVQLRLSGTLLIEPISVNRTNYKFAVGVADELKLCTTFATPLCWPSEIIYLDKIWLTRRCLNLFILEYSGNLVWILTICWKQLSRVAWVVHYILLSVRPTHSSTCASRIVFQSPTNNKEWKVLERPPGSWRIPVAPLYMARTLQHTFRSRKTDHILRSRPLLNNIATAPPVPSRLRDTKISKSLKIGVESRMSCSRWRLLHPVLAIWGRCIVEVSSLQRWPRAKTFSECILRTSMIARKYGKETKRHLLSWVYLWSSSSLLYWIPWEAPLLAVTPWDHVSYLLIPCNARINR